mmetsp:Transcript_11662/g.18338  ORF Transcript_11662/g.18338 Transcript_11662/m.18338 type:complete len:212 (+) Transcript_11662:660-1295(+)
MTKAERGFRGHGRGDGGRDGLDGLELRRGGANMGHGGDRHGGNILTQVLRSKRVVHSGFEIDNALQGSGVLGLDNVHFHFKFINALAVTLARGGSALTIAHAACFLAPGLEFVAVHWNSWIVARVLLDTSNRRPGLGGDRVQELLLFIGRKLVKFFLHNSRPLPFSARIAVRSFILRNGSLLVTHFDPPLACQGSSAVVRRYLSIVGRFGG